MKSYFAFFVLLCLASLFEIILGFVTYDPERTVVPKGYVEIEHPNDALAECIRMVEGLRGNGKELERHYFWSDTGGGIVEMLYEGEVGAGPFRALAKCVLHADGSIVLLSTPADMIDEKLLRKGQPTQ
jgi:hypothetical protein